MRGIDGAAAFVHHQAVVAVRGQLGRLRGGRDERDLVIKHAIEQRLFLAKRREVRRLGGSLQMSRAFESAFDALISDQRLERRDGVARDLKQRAGARLAVPRDERGRIDLQPGQHLSGVAGAGARTYLPALEHHHRGAGSGQVVSGRQSCISRADNSNVEPARLQISGSGRGRRPGHRFPPIGVVLQGRYSFMGQPL